MTTQLTTANPIDAGERKNHDRPRRTPDAFAREIASRDPKIDDEF